MTPRGRPSPSSSGPDLIGKTIPHLPLILVALATLAALVMLAQRPHFHADDAYIVARYAENLVTHGQIVWNAGEVPVEGFTGYTLLFLMTVATWLHLPPISATSVIGIVAWFVGARILYAARVPLGISPLAAAIATALFLCAPEQATHAMSSLETETFILLTVACAFVATRRAQEKPGMGRVWLLPILAALCAYTRPEGIVVGGAFFLAVLVHERSAWRAWTLPTVLGFVTPVGALHLFRRLYFGDFFPNTYYAKKLAPGQSSAFLSSFSMHAEKYLLPSIIAAMVVVLLARSLGQTPARHSDATRAARRIFTFGTVLGYVAIGLTYARSDLVMNYSERFAFHLFGLSMLLVMLALGELHRHWRVFTAAPAIRRSAFFLTAAGVYLPFAAAFGQWRNEYNYRTNYMRGVQLHYVPVAAWLHRHASPTLKLAVYPDAGIIPYRTNLETIDFGKLNDKYLAREARTSKDIVDYFFRRNPDAVVLLLSQGFDRTYDAAGNDLLADPRFAAYHLTLLSLDQGIGTAFFVKR
jgi:hypothetical protein